MAQPRDITAWLEVPASWGDPPRRFVFSEPVEVWQAGKLHEVRPALERVAAAQRDGLYVVGFLTYESAPAFDPAMSTRPAGDLPFAWFAAFSSPRATGGQHGGTQEPLVKRPSFKFQVSEVEYVSAVHRALDHIRSGDIYQVNYTVRAELEVTDPFALFRTLLVAAPMPHAAYIDAGPAQVISLSPELFLRRRGNILESRPMKGTARREPSWLADEAARVALSRDEKNRAENVMIVDLVRNDLGRVCQMGSVTVPELWRVDRFPTVHQMTSLVRGELRENVSLFDIFAALFPPGSVTGAPKIRAMQIISELEPEPRGIYCGTIGLFFPNGDFECNVAIRTLQRIKDKGERIKKEPPPDLSPSSFLLSPCILGLGSGIVADSDPETEWMETQLKGEFVTLQPRDFILYETILYDQSIKDKGERRKEENTASSSASSFLLSPFSFLDLHSHLRRLRQSCIYFGRPFPLSRIIHHLRELQATLGDAPARVKLDLHFDDIETHVIRENLSWPEGGMTVMLSDLRLDPEDFRLYHKTNLRPEKYEELEKARARGATEVLFLNTRGELCEGALSNLALKINGEWLTPALHCGLLPGTWREKQLASGRLREAVLTLDDLRRAEEICLGNAVRGEGRVTGIIYSRGGPLV
jgi:para-aminobenzoate synthetase / 4-amino-4-deoxychorismate lyase